MPEISRFYGIIVKMIPVLHKSPTAPSLRDFRSRLLQTKKRIRDHVNDLESFFICIYNLCCPDAVARLHHAWK